MANVVVPALKALTYQGRSYVRGEMVCLPAVEASARARKGEVSLTRGAVVSGPAYQTRDMAADDVQAPRRRRRYRRRDMTADAAAAQD